MVLVKQNHFNEISMSTSFDADASDCQTNYEELDLGVGAHVASGALSLYILCRTLLAESIHTTLTDAIINVRTVSRRLFHGCQNDALDLPDRKRPSHVR